MSCCTTAALLPEMNDSRTVVRTSPSQARYQLRANTPRDVRRIITIATVCSHEILQGVDYAQFVPYSGDIVFQRDRAGAVKCGCRSKAVVVFRDNTGRSMTAEAGSCLFRHFFTVDVEEYFQVAALSPFAPKASWGSFESRVEPAIDQLLELLAAYGATGTFFTVGWVAERHTAMVKRIAQAGHELASHTYDHSRVTHQTPNAFRSSIRRTKQILEDLTGTPVVGFRAPSFSIVRGTEWALDLLIEEGHTYDSSLFPVSRSGYGYAGGQRDPYWINRPSGRIAEIPPATLQVLGKTLPAGGGAYFRILPPQLVHAALRSSESRGVPGTFYIHPWEWDPGQPVLEVPMLTRVRHYCGQRTVFSRIEHLLDTFAFGSISSVLTPEMLGANSFRLDRTSFTAGGVKRAGVPDLELPRVAVVRTHVPMRTPTPAETSSAALPPSTRP